MPYIVKCRFKDGRIVPSPSVADHAVAIDDAKHAWMENSDLAEVTVEDELGKYVWVVFADGVI